MASQWRRIQVARISFFLAPLSGLVDYIYAAAMQVFTGFGAANDANFSACAGRTKAIPESVTPIPNYPTKLRIYQTNASRYWQVCCYFKGKTHKQSLRTTNKKVAISGAKNFFHLKVAELYGEQRPEREDKCKPFKDFVQAALSAQLARVKRGEFTQLSLDILRSRLLKSVVPYFGDKDVRSINFQHISEYMHALSNEGKSTTTIQQHLVAMRKVLTYAQSLNELTSVPKFPSIKISNSPRGSYTLQEYLRMVKVARRLRGMVVPKDVTAKSRRGDANLDKFARVSEDFHWLIRFMVNGFMRPTDIRNLKHKHVTVVRGKHVYLRLNLPESKKHDAPIVTLQPAVHVYERLLAWQQRMGYGKPDDYLFLPEQPKRNLVLETYRWQLIFVQHEAGVGANAANNQQRTLYSFRHTSLTFRLLYGKNVDLITLARNARTSVEMIEKFYSSNLRAEMNIDLIHGKRG